MNTKRNFLKGGLQLAFGQAGQQGLQLVRNIVVARLLPPEQFGIALTFITVLSTLDALSDVGIELYLTRSHGNDDPKLQATLQSLLMARGLFAAICIFALAGPIAQLFNAPDAVWAYRLLAAVPLIKGFLHLDTKRFERNLRYWPGILNHIVAVALGTAAAIGLALWTQDYSAILAAYIVQTLSLSIGSRLLAEQPYRLAYNRDYARQLFAFGAPLILNGMMLFAALQGDRIVIGAAMGPQELARYGVVGILTAGVTIIVMRVTSSLYVPLLAKYNPGDDAYARRFDLLGAVTMLLAVLAMVGFGTIGKDLATLAFGAKYAISAEIVLWLGIQCAFKIMRSWRQFSFLASARTLNVLIVNISSLVGILLAAVAVHRGYGAEAVAKCMALGEITAALVAVLLGAGADGRLRSIGIRFVAGLAGFAIVLVLFNMLVPDAALMPRIALLVALLAASGLAALAASAALRAQAGKSLEALRGRNKP